MRCKLKKVYQSLICILIIVSAICSMTLTINASGKKPTQNLQVVYFFSSKCLSCRENADYIERLSKIEGVELIKYNTDIEDCSSIQCAYAKQFNVNEQDYLTVPYIYFGSYAYKLSPQLHNEVTSKIHAYVNGDVPFENFKYEAASCGPSVFEKLMKNMSVAGILLAGLLDGINPCAISMLIVFLSFLLCIGNKKRSIFLSFMFIVGIFVANFTFGLGVKSFYNLFAGNNIVLFILYFIAISMCVLAIFLNITDIIRHKNGSSEKNQLPDRIKFKLSSLMRKAAFSKFAIPTIIGVGFLVGIIELACTGQIYLPTLTYMITSGSKSVQSILLLFLYNVMFVLPLSIVTIVASVVKQPEDVKTSIMKKNHIIKGIAIAFFAVMLFVLLKDLFAIF